MDDVMVDLNADLVVYRVQGKWNWKSRKELTKAEVILALESQAQRLDIKSDLLLEAAKWLSSVE